MMTLAEYKDSIRDEFREQREYVRQMIDGGHVYRCEPCEWALSYQDMGDSAPPAVSLEMLRFIDEDNIHAMKVCAECLDAFDIITSEFLKAT